MENKRKLIIANIFAFVSLAIIALGMKLSGFEIGFSGGSILPTSLLVILPQMGFFYFYLKSNKFPIRKAVA